MLIYLFKLLMIVFMCYGMIVVGIMYSLFYYILNLSYENLLGEKVCFFLEFFDFIMVCEENKVDW